MISARHLLCGVALALLTARAAAQDEASALAWMLDRADVVGVVRTLAVHTEPGATIRVTLRVERRLAGASPDILVLEEPDSQGCGRALQGLVPGQRLLACLRRRGDGFVPCAGGGRGLPLATTALVAHAAALLAADAQGRVQILISALADGDARIAGDAALALALAPGLEAAGPTARAEVVAALTGAIATSARTTPSLLTAAVRLEATEIIDVLLPLHLEGADAPFEAAFVAALTQIDPVATAARVASAPLASAAARLRAVQLLRHLPPQPAATGLWSVLRQTAEPGVRLQACAELLRAGVDARDLRDAVGQDTLTSAMQLAAPTSPRLRFVQPRTR